MTTYPAQRIVGVITKKGYARGTFIFLCMLFEEFHVRFLEYFQDSIFMSIDVRTIKKELDLKRSRQK